MNRLDNVQINPVYIYGLFLGPSPSPCENYTVEFCRWQSLLGNSNMINLCTLEGHFGGRSGRAGEPSQDWTGLVFQHVERLKRFIFNIHQKGLLLKGIQVNSYSLKRKNDTDVSASSLCPKSRDLRSLPVAGPPCRASFGAPPSPHPLSPETCCSSIVCTIALSHRWPSS